MKTMNFSIFINAPKEKVWHTMLDDATYREWTQEFNTRGSWYEGDWSAGSTIKFLGPGENGELGGMVAKINENRLYEYVSIEHQGLISNGVIDTTSDAVKQWTPAWENYTFTEKDGGTELHVEMRVPDNYADEYKKMFETLWPRALKKLKEITEKTL